MTGSIDRAAWEGARRRFPSAWLWVDTRSGAIRFGDAPGRRVGWIDGARGLSIVLMIVSHVDLVLGAPLGWWFHVVLMRPVAPVFMMLFATLWRPGWRRRHWHLVGGAVVAQLCVAFLFGTVPNILVLLLWAVLLMPFVDRWPVVVILVAVNQLAFWPVPDWWTGYPPGLLLAFLVAGRHLSPAGFLEGYGRVGSWLRLEAVGRRPMTWYVGHLVFLVWAVWTYAVL